MTQTDRSPLAALRDRWNKRADQIDAEALARGEMVALAIASVIRECSNQLSALLAAQEIRQDQEQEGDTRVDEPSVNPPERATAAENETKEAAVTPGDAAFVLLQKILAAASVYEQHAILTAALRASRAPWLHRAFGAEDLLNQLRNCDILDCAADGPYWRGRIDAHFARSEMDPPNFITFTPSAAPVSRPGAGSKDIYPK